MSPLKPQPSALLSPLRLLLCTLAAAIAVLTTPSVPVRAAAVPTEAAEMPAWLTGKSVIYEETWGRMQLDFKADGRVSSLRLDRPPDSDRRSGTHPYRVLRGGAVVITFFGDAQNLKLLRFSSTGRHVTVLDDVGAHQGYVFSTGDAPPGATPAWQPVPELDANWDATLRGSQWRERSPDGQMRDFWIQFLGNGLALRHHVHGSRYVVRCERIDGNTVALYQPDSPGEIDGHVPLRIHDNVAGSEWAGLLEPLELAGLDREGFQQWLIGTEWRDSTQFRNQRFEANHVRFNEDGRYVRQFRDREQTGRFTVTHPGVILMEREDNPPLQLTIHPDLTSGMLRVDGARRRILRTSTSENLAHLTEEDEFHRWLVGTRWRWRYADRRYNTIEFTSGSELMNTLANSNNRSHAYEVVSPGLIEFNLDAADALGRIQVRFHDDLLSASVQAWGEQYYALALDDYPHDRPREPMFHVPTGPGGTMIAGQNADVGSGEGPPPIELKRRLSQVQSLLVAELESGRMAGMSSTLSLAALPAVDSGLASVGFNQEIGPDMSTALQEVVKFHQLRHGAWPRDHRLEFSFANRYTLKDGPSVAVAAALLMESLLTDLDLDPRFSVTGDVNIDGSVQSVGGVAAKLRGASGGGATLLAIPEANRMRLIDLVLSEGPGPLLSIQVFTLTTFDDALALAAMEKSAEITEAIEQFDNLRARLGGVRDVTAALRQAVVQDQLSQVLARAPNHLSARVLLLAGQGRLPSQLSLPGSLEAIDHGAYDILAALDQDVTAVSQLDGGKVAAAVGAMRRLRPQVHPRTRELCDTIIELGDLIRGYLDTPPSSRRSFEVMRNQFGAVGRRIDAQYQSLASDPGVMEELLR